jgi:5-formyltetrahydrofolate cyclo-ligase
LNNQATILNSKEALRREMKSLFKKADSAWMDRESLRVRQTIAAQPLWQNSKSILFYAPILEEVDIWPLINVAIQKGSTACLPRYIPQKDVYEAAIITNTDTDLIEGHFGVREPAPGCPRLLLNRLDFILVPGVAFDSSGSRLGRGRGYYDRLLPMTQGLRCGVGYEQQIRSEIPVEPHDIHVDYVATPQRWIVVSPHAAS